MAVVEERIRRVSGLRYVCEQIGPGESYEPHCPSGADWEISFTVYEEDGPSHGYEFWCDAHLPAKYRKDLPDDDVEVTQ